jgi:hypothetical protein
MTNGELYFYTALIGIIVFIIINFKNPKNIFVLILVSPIIFEIISLFNGSSAIWVPDLFPFRMYNIRYGLYAAPFVFIFMSILFGNLKKVGYYLMILIIIIQVGQSINYGIPITLKDGLTSAIDDGNKSVIDAAKYIKQNYKFGLILTSAGVLDPFIFLSGLQNKTFITEGIENKWNDSLKEPSKYAEWVVFTKPQGQINERDGIQVTYYSNLNMFNNYKEVFNEGAVLIYKKI